MKLAIFPKINSLFIIILDKQTNLFYITPLIISILSFFTTFPSLYYLNLGLIIPKLSKSLQNLYKTLFNNLSNFNKCYQRSIYFLGVGYTISKLSPILFMLKLGYSHKLLLKVPTSIHGEINKTDQILTLTSSNYYLLTHISSKIKSLENLNIYTNKGISFSPIQAKKRKK